MTHLTPHTSHFSFLLMWTAWTCLSRLDLTMNSLPHHTMGQIYKVSTNMEMKAVAEGSTVYSILEKSFFPRRLGPTERKCEGGEK
jgi:hypothetical protein